ncbi:MAG: DUF4430 domain-containing protein [Candidatus Magasanikbacteria bacterium]|nr:DUF4430 domain-containing protein [Candidatus Magasanikbacteria bacterium]
MQDRRDFLQSVVGFFALSATAYDLDLDSPQETVLDYLLRVADDVSYEVRQVDGVRKAYVTSINGWAEDKEAKLYWLFTVDGEFMDAAANEVRVGRDSVVRWQRVRPQQLGA